MGVQVKVSKLACHPDPGKEHPTQGGETPKPLHRPLQQPNKTVTIYVLKRGKQKERGKNRDFSDAVIFENSKKIKIYCSHSKKFIIE